MADSRIAEGLLTAFCYFDYRPRYACRRNFPDQNPRVTARGTGRFFQPRYDRAAIVVERHRGIAERVSCADVDRLAERNSSIFGENELNLGRILRACKPCNGDVICFSNDSAGVD